LDRAFPTVCYCTRIRGKYFSNHFKEFFVILFFILFYLFIPGRRACAAILAESPERETGEFRRENLSFLGIGAADVHKFGGWGGDAMPCAESSRNLYYLEAPATGSKPGTDPLGAHTRLVLIRSISTSYQERKKAMPWHLLQHFCNAEPAAAAPS
jgi:hypothetical protein